MPKRKFFLKFFLSLLTLTVFLPSSATPPDALAALATYRWQARLLLVFTPNLAAAAWQTQLLALQAEVAALAERRLRVLVVTADAIYWLGFKPATTDADLPQAVLLPPAEDFPDAAALWNVYRLKSTAAAVLLVGLDGEVKARYALPVALGEVFAEIDQMPMRQWELRQR